MARPTHHRSRWRIRPVDHTGRRLCLTYDTLEEAEQALAEIERGKRALQEGRVEAAPAARTFQELAAYYRLHHLPALRSQRAATSILASLEAFLGAVAVSDIDQRAADSYLAWLRQKPLPGRGRRPRKPATLRNHLTLLVAMLNLAADLRWIDRAPRIRKPRVLEQPFQALDSLDDVRRLLAAARGMRPCAEPLYATALLTGLRQGELAGLRWGDIDFGRRLVTVARSWDRPATKSGRVRRVPILDPLLPILRDWRAGNPGNGWVFTNEEGGQLLPCNRIFRECWHRALAEAGLPEIRFHDARHSFASLWVAAGGDLYRLQGILGHQSTQMTSRYAHLRPDVYASEWGRLGGPLSVAAEEQR